MKKKKLSTIILAGLALVCSFVLSAGRLAYADSNSMTVSPPYQKMILVPGETYENMITVSNASNSTRNLKYAIDIGAFSQKKDGNSKGDEWAPNDISSSSYNQIMDWIKIEDTKGEIEPGETKDIKYKIEVPKNAPGGGQYATILVVDETTSGLPGEGNIGIDQKYQFASIIYAEVAGDTKKDGVISSNSMPTFLLDGNLVAESMVKNNGNVHTDAEYTLQVWPAFSGEEICTNEEKPETSLVLPETEHYHTQSCELPSIGIFKAKQVVKLFGDSSVVERTIIVCPLWLLFVIVFAILLLIGWIIFRLRTRKKRA